MNARQLLHFYFYADKLDKMIQNLITKVAVSSAAYLLQGDVCGEKICTLIYTKQKLSELFDYIDKDLQQYTEEQLTALKQYVDSDRKQLSSFPPEKRKVIRAATTKFQRHMNGIDELYSEQIALLERYNFIY